jgi:hypothetical protein
MYEFYTREETAYCEETASRTQGNHKFQGIYATNHQKWLTEKLTTNLPPKSVSVPCIAPFHSVQFNEAPTSQAKNA